MRYDLGFTGGRSRGSNLGRLSRRFYKEPASAAIYAIYMRERSSTEWSASRSTIPQPSAPAIARLQPDVTGMVTWSGRRREPVGYRWLRRAQDTSTPVLVRLKPVCRCAAPAQTQRFHPVRD